MLITASGSNLSRATIAVTSFVVLAGGSLRSGFLAKRTSSLELSIAIAALAKIPAAWESLKEKIAVKRRVSKKKNSE
jgi:hypothetical protein